MLNDLDFLKGKTRAEIVIIDDDRRRRTLEETAPLNERPRRTDGSPLGYVSRSAIRSSIRSEQI